MLSIPSQAGRLAARLLRLARPRLASLPLPAQPDADGFITLRAPLQNAPATTDVCLWFTGDTRPTMWVLDRVTLIPR